MKIDIDNARDYFNFWQSRLPYFRDFFKVKDIWIRERKSPSGKGWHIIIELPRAKLSEMEIVFLQLFLLSDFKREAFNMARVRSGKFPDGSWNVLFKEKHVARLD